MVEEVSFESCVYKVMKENRFKDLKDYLSKLGKTLGICVAIVLGIAFAIVLGYYVIAIFGPVVLGFIEWAVLGIVAFCNELYIWIVTNWMLICIAIIVLSFPLAPISVFYGYKEYSIHQSRYYCLRKWEQEGRAVDPAEDVKILNIESDYRDNKDKSLVAWGIINTLVVCILLGSLWLSGVTMLGILLVICVVVIASVTLGFCGFMSSRMC